MVGRSRSDRLEGIRTFIGQWERGHVDGQEVVIDALTNLRHFAAEQAVDFDEVLRISRDHFSAEVLEARNSATGREIVTVGWDGRSQPMLRYADEMHLAEHARSIVSLGDRNRVALEAGEDPVAHWVERGESGIGDLHLPSGSIIRAGMTLAGARRDYADHEIVEVSPCGCHGFADGTGEPCPAHHPDAPVHMLDRRDPEYMTVAEEGAAEVSDHLERHSK